MSSVLVLEGKSAAEIEHKVKAEYVESLTANYALWVPAQFLNFYFIPVPFQVVCSCQIQTATHQHSHMATLPHHHTDH